MSAGSKGMQYFSGKRMVFVALLTLLITVYFTPYRLTLVKGQSMTPTIKSGQLLLVDRGYYHSHALRRGDVVTFRHNGETFIKRIYALPGDEVIQLCTPGSPNMIVPPEQEERYRRSILSRQPEAKLVKTRIAPGQVFMLGDGNMFSRDSRDFGTVAQQTVIGKASPLLEGQASLLTVPAAVF